MIEYFCSGEYSPGCEAGISPLAEDIDWSLCDPKLADVTYFTFVTMSTLGYGDVLPGIPLTRSLSIFISITGQIYLAVIIAMLVGKYSAQKSN